MFTETRTTLGSADEVRAFIAALKHEYVHGTPANDWQPGLEDNPDDMLGGFLGSLTTYDPDQPGVIEAILEDCGIDTLDKFRATLRLVSTYGAIAVLSWALDEPVPTCTSWENRKLNLDEVLREVCGEFSDKWGR